MRTIALMGIVAAAACTLGSAQVPAVDWEREKPEILRHHRSLVQIDTSNPPGNETKAAEYLKKVFDAGGHSRAAIRAGPDAR